MEHLPNGITLEIPSGCFPLSTDSVVLAHFAGGIGSGAVLDLCAGCGTIGLMLCAVNPRCTVTGLEISEAAHLGALDNIRSNALEKRISSVCADVRQVPSLFTPGSFAYCISNPPYFSNGPASAAGIARREDSCSLEELMRSAGWALKFGGDFYLVHRPERLGEAIALGEGNNLETKRIGLVRHKEGSPVALVLLQLRKGAKPGLKIEDWILHDRSGAPTQLYRDIYHLQED